MLIKAKWNQQQQTTRTAFQSGSHLQTNGSEEKDTPSSCSSNNYVQINPDIVMRVNIQILAATLLKLGIVIALTTEEHFVFQDLSAVKLMKRKVAKQ